MKLEHSNREIVSQHLVVNTCGSFDVDINFEQLRPYGRRDYFIAYIVSGKMIIHEPDKDIVAKPGDIVVYRPKEVQHYSLFKNDGHNYFYIHFTGSGCKELLEKVGIGKERIYTIGESETVKQIFERLEREYLFKKPFFEERCLGFAYELFSVLGRRLFEPENSGNNMDKRIVKVCNKMLRDYTEWHTINYYAALCDLSVSRFSHLFKSQVGSTPLDYVMQIRMERASKMLTETDLSVIKISQLLGFNDHNYFIRTFKRHIGKTPMKFRKSLE